jgi:ribonucleotide reductase class II
MSEHIFDKVSTAYPVFYNAYSRVRNGNRESWQDVCVRTSKGFQKLGKLTDEETEKLRKNQENLLFLPSGRFLWVGGTPWSEKPENFFGTYNCTSISIESWSDFQLVMDLSMQGCGTGTVVEQENIKKLPIIQNKINVTFKGQPGDVKKGYRLDLGGITKYDLLHNEKTLYVDYLVGDSRQGWCQTYWDLLTFAAPESVKKDPNTLLIDMRDAPGYTVNLCIDLSHVRPKGERLKSFGGEANPAYLQEMFANIADILNGAIGRKLNSLEVCLILSEAALAIVAGNVRRSASIRQGSPDDAYFVTSKDNLWQQDTEGNWGIAPGRDCLRMANHTIVFHEKPSLDVCIEAVRKQYYSGEGAIQWAGEAVARANADILKTFGEKRVFLSEYQSGTPEQYFLNFTDDNDDYIYPHTEILHRIKRYGTNPCLRGDMKLLTTEGYKTFEELENTSPKIINKFGEISQSEVWCSGEKDVVKITLTGSKRLYCTPDHRFQCFEGVYTAQNLKGKQLQPLLVDPTLKMNLQYVLYGFIQGDGCTNSLDKSKTLLLNVGAKDHEIISILESLNLDFKWSPDGRHVYVYDFAQNLKSLGFIQETLPNRTLPPSFYTWSKQEKASFLHGLYGANGSVISNGRVTFKTTCVALATSMQTWLKDLFDIDSYITTNKSKNVEFSNGVYECRESYDLNIMEYYSRLKFFNEIGFALSYHQEKLANILLKQAPKVRSVKSAGKSKVYDFTEPETHWGVVEGFVTHNCGI